MAAGPIVIMIYGSQLSEPVFVVQNRPGDLDRYAGVWCARATATPVSGVYETDRPYLNMAMFWGGEFADMANSPDGVALLRTLTPAQANQHGRLLLPRDGVRPAVVVTDAAWAPSANPTSPERRVGPDPRPVPAEVSAFQKAC